MHIAQVVCMIEQLMRPMSG